MKVNLNIEIKDLAKPVLNTASSSTDMMTIAQVFWKGVHLWDLSEDKLGSNNPWAVYAADKGPVLNFCLGLVPSRADAEARVHAEAFRLEACLRHLWFLPAVSRQTFAKRPCLRTHS